MAKSKIGSGRLIVYSTKIEAETKELLEALSKFRGKGHRELIDEFLGLYQEKHPDHFARAQKMARTMAALMAGEDVEDLEDEPEAAAAEPEPAPPAHEPKTVMTVRYAGRPQTHLYEPNSKNGTGCALAGEIDLTTVKKQDASAVDCKKCRFCRKAAFE